MFAIDRRKLLTSSFGALVLSCLPTSIASVLKGTRPATTAHVEQVLREFLRDPRAARAVGQRVLALHREAADPRPLIAALEAETNPAMWRAALRQRRREELGSGQSLVVDGWVLARSEAQLCALFALEESARS